MLRKGRVVWCCACLLLWAVGCAFCGKPCCTEQSPEARTGYPSEVAPWAHPSDTGKYIGYEVGGGSACHADGPSVCDGTWGWDYEGYFLPSRIILDWFHGTKYQGGSGAYKTDGPRPVEELQRQREERE
jgi:hypothetical protein